MKSRFAPYRIIIVFLLLSTFQSLSSLGQNPFDIKSRTVTEEKQSQTINPPTSSDNPFDITTSPSAQRYPSKQASEIKQNVNGTIEGISRPWKVGILLLSIVSFVLIRLLNTTGFNKIIQSLVSSIKLAEFRNSFNGLFNMQIGLFFIFFIGNLAYFIYLISVHRNVSLPFTIGNTYITLFGAVASIYIVKYIVLLLLEYGMSIKRVISNHIFSVSIHNAILGGILFLVNTFLAFTSNGLFNSFMWIGIILIALVYLIRQLKGVIMLSELRHFSIFHFFIYLCSCEIAPLLVGFKFITG